MRAGDIKKCCEKAISSERRDGFNPRDFNINDNFLLAAFMSYHNNEPADQIEKIVSGFITTEKLTAERRVAVLKMVKDVLIGLSKPNLTIGDRDRLRSILTAYFV